MKNLPLKTLFQHYADDHPDVFTSIYEQTLPRVQIYLNKRLKNQAAVAEIQQNAYLKLHRMRHRFNAEYDPWQWVYVILRSEMLDYLKKSQQESLLLENFLSQNTAEDRYHYEASDEGDERLEPLLESLDPKSKELIQRRFFNEESFEELAEEMGIAPAGIRKRLSRALKSLRDRLGEDS